LRSLREISLHPQKIRGNEQNHKNTPMNLSKRFSAVLIEKIGNSAYEAFENALDQTPPVSIRINPKKGKDLFILMEK